MCEFVMGELLCYLLRNAFELYIIKASQTHLVFLIIHWTPQKLLILDKLVFHSYAIPIR